MSRVRRSLPLVAWLTLVWVGLWGSLTPANVLGGLAVALVLVTVLPLDPVPDTAVVRPLGVLRVVGFFAVDLVRASLQVARLAVLPGTRLRPAVIAVPVRGATDSLLTLLANAISLTPGTLTLQVDRPAAVLYVHVITVGDDPDGVEKVRRSVRHLEELAILAVGSAEGRRALAEERSAR